MRFQGENVETDLGKTPVSIPPGRPLLPPSGRLYRYILTTSEPDPPPRPPIPANKYHLVCARQKQESTARKLLVLAFVPLSTNPWRPEQVLLILVSTEHPGIRHGPVTYLGLIWLCVTKAVLGCINEIFKPGGDKCPGVGMSCRIVV